MLTIGVFWGTDRMNKEKLTFEDGVLLCKHIFQCAIQKTLNGVPEQWDIFYKIHEVLETIGQGSNNDRLFDILFSLNIEDIYAKM